MKVNILKFENSDDIKIRIGNSYTPKVWDKDSISRLKIREVNVKSEAS